MGLLGAHVSTAGGLREAVRRGEELGCEAIQVFVKSPQQWRLPPLGRGEAARGRAALAASPIRTAVAHATYLVNLAAVEGSIRERSRRLLSRELERAERLGLAALVVHPGAHRGAGERLGVERAAASLDWVLRRRAGCGARLVLENTAGQGTVLGRTLEELAAIRRRCRHGRRLGVCIDTCHAFAAGYRLDRKPVYDRFVERCDELFGDGALVCLHLNDSRHAAGSRRDRHANLGRGAIGTALFRRLVNDPRLATTPMLLETPRGADGDGHRRDLELLRRMVRARSSAGRRGA